MFEALTFAELAELACTVHRGYLRARNVPGCYSTPRKRGVALELAEVLDDASGDLSDRMAVMFAPTAV